MKYLRLAVLALTALLFAGAAFAQTAPKATTNRSVVITTGNTFQTVLASGSRLSITIENNNTTNNCWVYVGATTATAARSILLLPGGSYTRYYPYIPSDVIQATCAASSDTLYIDTQP